MKMRSLISRSMAFLVGVWLLLNDTLQPAQVVLGLLLTGLALFLTASGQPLRARPRRLLLILSLLAHVMADIVRSNIAVARVIFGSRARRTNSDFLQIPIELRDPHGLAMLACIITATPGTVWAGLSPDGATLTLHVLDLQDEESWIRVIKDRYEQPLKEIFE
jgi:multicomponent K+:H+ antiporter subunit E